MESCSFFNLRRRSDLKVLCQRQRRSRDAQLVRQYATAADKMAKTVSNAAHVAASSELLIINL